MADVGEILKSVLSTIRVPQPGDRVHKDECALSFSSPVSFSLSTNQNIIMFSFICLKSPLLSISGCYVNGTSQGVSTHLVALASCIFVFPFSSFIEHANVLLG